ncbi:hypothetical protein ACLOJK_031712 [Asimina triloba]
MVVSFKPNTEFSTVKFVTVATGGVSTVAAVAANHTHSTLVIAVALLQACHTHADMPACCRHRHRALMASIAGIEQAVATSVDNLEAARAGEMCDGGRGRRTRRRGWCRWLQVDGEDDVLTMIIMMGGLDRSIQAPVVVSRSVVGISGRKWLRRWATGERRDVGSEVQPSLGCQR